MIIFDHHDRLRSPMITFAHQRHFSRMGAPRRVSVFGMRPVKMLLND
jgi:hypothetical protein